MGQSTTVVTDSLACLTSELAEQYNIVVVPLSFMLQGIVYRDWVDIKPTQAYELFLKDPDSFQSSAPSPVDFQNAFRDASKRAKNILCITLSAKLSTTVNVAMMVGEQIAAEIPGVKVEVLDSGTVTAAEGLIALAAARAAAAGKELSDVIKEARDCTGKVKFYALLDTIRHVYRSGRVPKIASQIGSVLHIKPILGVSPETGGVVRFVGVARSRQSGIERVIKMIKDEVGDRPIRAAVMHAYAPEEARELQKIVAESFNCRELWLSEFTPLMGYATGTGTLGVAFHTEE